MWIFVIAFGFAGLVSLIAPQLTWLWSNWWRYQGDAEPSSLSLWLYRVGGAVLLAVSIGMAIKLVTG